MRTLILALLVSAICCELLVTREYTEYLKKTVSWEVVDYEDNVFRGWTTEDAKNFLGAVPQMSGMNLPYFEPTTPAPAALSWVGASCIHDVRNQGNCGSCWAFGLAGMLADRCCLSGSDKGWLAPQELVSCDKKSSGCSGGWPEVALQYVVEKHGLVPEACYPYKGINAVCPTKCADGSDWTKAHVCDCKGAKRCRGVEAMKGCLASGPIEVTFGVCNSFFSYRTGIYKCDCGGSYAGLHAVTAVGFGSDPECHWVVRNSWGASWGDKGYFKMACSSCGMDGTYEQGNVYCETVA